MEYPDSCCLGKQEKDGYAPPHCLLRPKVYDELRKDKTFKFHRVLNQVHSFSCQLEFRDPLGKGSNIWNTKIVVIPFCKNMNLKKGFNFSSSNEDKEILKRYYIYQSSNVMRHEARKGYDLPIILG